MQVERRPPDGRVRGPGAHHRADRRGHGDTGAGPVRQQPADTAQRDVRPGRAGQPAEGVPAQLPHRADRRDGVPRADQPGRAGPVQQSAHVRAVVRVPRHTVPARSVRGPEPHTEDRGARLLRLPGTHQAGRVAVRPAVHVRPSVRRRHPLGDTADQREPADRVVRLPARVAQQAPVHRAERQPVGVRLPSETHEALAVRQQRAVQSTGPVRRRTGTAVRQTSDGTGRRGLRL